MQQTCSWDSRPSTVAASVAGPASPHIPAMHCAMLCCAKRPAAGVVPAASSAFSSASNDALGAPAPARSIVLKKARSASSAWPCRAPGRGVNSNRGPSLHRTLSAAQARGVQLPACGFMHATKT